MPVPLASSLHFKPPATASYLLQVDDHLPADVLAARLAKEAVALPRFASGGEWRRKTRTLSELHAWTWGENTAYASKRLLVDRAPTDPELLKSY